MIYSKFLIFDEDDSEKFINERICEFENEGWEVAEHRLATCHSGISERVKITVLMQKCVEAKPNRVSVADRSKISEIIEDLS